MIVIIWELQRGRGRGSFIKMSDHAGGEQSNGRRPPDKRRGGTGRRRYKSGPRSNSGASPGGARSKPGPIGLNRIGGNDFELVHPRAVRETELDYEEGIELWKAGDPESARDALRYTLSACHDNIWAHVALGQIALVEFRDPGLARGHFGYAFELRTVHCPRGSRVACRETGPIIGPFSRRSTAWPRVSRPSAVMMTPRACGRSALGCRAGHPEGFWEGGRQAIWQARRISCRRLSVFSTLVIFGLAGIGGSR